jgi:predicted glutamine amidotransferase
LAWKKMCRMFAFSGDYDDTPMILQEFRTLAQAGKVLPGVSPGHKDGWGITCYLNGALKELGRHPTDAMADERYTMACEETARMRPRILIAHLRKASRGMETSLTNTQPLRWDSWTFGHNGTIWSPAFRRKNGESDSIAFLERLMSLVQAKRDSNALHQTIAESVRQIRRAIQENPDSMGRTYSSLTFVLSDGRSLYVLRDFSEGFKDRDYEDYYTMHYLKSPNYVLFCQEQLISGDWRPLTNKTMAIVSPNGDLEIVSCQ